MNISTDITWLEFRLNVAADVVMLVLTALQYIRYLRLRGPAVGRWVNEIATKGASTGYCAKKAAGGRGGGAC